MSKCKSKYWMSLTVPNEVSHLRVNKCLIKDQRTDSKVKLIGQIMLLL